MRRTIVILTVGALLVALTAGAALAATGACKAEVRCLGTRNADTLLGSGGHDDIRGRGGNDTLKGFGAFDDLYGQGRSDKLLGGPGKDYLVGGSGRDTLAGGAADDYYLFGPQWGKDSINDSSLVAQQNKVSFHDSVGGMGAQVTEKLIIDLVAGDGPEVKNPGATNTVNWDAGVIRNVGGGDGDDTITGNGLNNIINGWEGDDTIYGGAGDDYVYIVDGSSGDTVHCGAGEDTVKYDVVVVGVALDSVDHADCEHLEAF